MTRPLNETSIPVSLKSFRLLSVYIDCTQLKDDNGYKLHKIEEFDYVNIVVQLPNNKKRVIKLPASEFDIPLNQLV